MVDEAGCDRWQLLSDELELAHDVSTCVRAKYVPGMHCGVFLPSRASKYASSIKVGECGLTPLT